MGHWVKWDSAGYGIPRHGHGYLRCQEQGRLVEGRSHDLPVQWVILVPGPLPVGEILEGTTEQAVRTLNLE